MSSTKTLYLELQRCPGLSEYVKKKNISDILKRRKEEIYNQRKKKKRKRKRKRISYLKKKKGE